MSIEAEWEVRFQFERPESVEAAFERMDEVRHSIIEIEGQLARPGNDPDWERRATAAKRHAEVEVESIQKWLDRKERLESAALAVAAERERLAAERERNKRWKAEADEYRKIEIEKAKLMTDGQLQHRVEAMFGKEKAKRQAEARERILAACTGPKAVLLGLAEALQARIAAAPTHGTEQEKALLDAANIFRGTGGVP